jgi:phosphoserine phosphatase
VISSPDVTRDPRFNSGVDKSTGFQTRSLLALPLVGFDKRLVGVIEFLNKGREGFTEADEEIAATLASLTAVALQRQMLLEERSEKQKLERDLAMARQIQRSLLPERDPVIEGFDIAGWSKAAHAVGGDFYDYLDLEDGRLGIVVGDAMGHGLDSALLACECRALIRAFASMTSDLERIITRVNDILLADLKAERFVTLFLGALDARLAHMSYVAAGQAPLFYCSRNEEARRLEATTLPLGIRILAPGNLSALLAMSPGDILALVSDGFEEWSNARDEQFGIDRLFAIIRKSSSEPSTEVIKRLHGAVVDFLLRPRQEDDLTAVVVTKI